MHDVAPPPAETTRKAALSAGFTLIEISIVLVIIGLIAGGVLVGQSLIYQAQIRTEIKDIEKFKTAIITFKVKYDCLPGDCANITNFLGSTDSEGHTIYNGNGNGNIETGATAVGPSVTPFTAFGHAWDSSGDREWYNVQHHLAVAGFVNTPVYDETVSYQGAGIIGQAAEFTSSGNASDVCNGAYPAFLAVGWFPGYSYFSGGHQISLGGAGAYFAGNCAGVNPWDAQAIDTKIDDGRPYSGSAVIMSNSYMYSIPGGAYGDSTYMCGNSATNTYLQSANIGGGSIPRLRMCAMYFQAGF